MADNHSMKSSVAIAERQGEDGANQEQSC